jgi:subtilase family serine protease
VTYNVAMQRNLFSRGPAIAVVVALVLPAITDAPAHARTRATTSTTIEVWMAGDEPAAQRFVQAVSTPGSPSFRRFVSPSAYTEQFGPSASQVGAVQSALTGAGFSAVSASVNDDYLSATAPESTIKHFTVPASIRSDVLAVTDPDSSRTHSGTAATAAPSPRVSAKPAACSRYWAQKTQTFTPAFRGLTKASVAPCGYSARQLRGAYGLTSANTGKGETIALVQIGGPDKMFQALTDYAKVNGLRAPGRGQYHEQAIGQGHRNPKCVNVGSTEAPLDSEAAYAMAPGANQLMVDGDDCDTSGGNYVQSLFDAELAPLTGTGSKASASIESVSYIFGRERDTTGSQLKIVHAIALRAAAEGVSLLTSSGDHAGVSSTSDPDLTVVGGTTLGIGAHDQRVFETGWSTAVGERTGDSGPWKDDGINAAGGGGVSAVVDEPGYQKGVVPSSMALDRAGRPGRTVPDISADGDPNTGARFGYIATHPGGKTTPFTPFTNAGTSMATPVVAGIVADAEQGQPRSFGFLNPLLYSRAGTRAFHDVLPLSPSAPQVDRGSYGPGLVETAHKLTEGFQVGVFDAQTPGRGHQVTAPGYDTMTGLGSPNGSAFIDALRSGTAHGDASR